MGKNEQRHTLHDIRKARHNGPYHGSVACMQTIDLANLQQIDVSYSPKDKERVRPYVFYNHPVYYNTSINKRPLISLINSLLFPKLVYINNNYDQKKGTSLKEVLIETTKFSRGVPKSLLFTFYSHISKDDLMLAVERMPHIEKLVLPRWCNHKDKSFVLAFSKWKNLKTLIKAHDCYLTGEFDFKAIGKTCTNLTNLKYLGYFRGYEEIVSYMKDLKRLSLRYSHLCSRGTLFLINGLQNLEKLNVAHCVYQDQELNPPLLGPVPNDSIVHAASKIDEFIKCSTDCNFCKGWIEWLTLSGEANLWNPYDRD